MEVDSLLARREECDECSRPIRSELGRDHCAACIMEETLNA